MSKVARSADLRMFEGARHPGDVCFAPTGVERRCESFEETEQSGSHMVSKGTFDTYLIIYYTRREISVLIIDDFFNLNYRNAQ